uniref:iron chaperone n=1 Tax=uncultured Oscillibacter sp. TaxID=876091 RepID=UPI00351CCC85
MEKILRGQEETAMWVCPKCGRSFKNAEQSHYCGEPPATIEEYIAAQPEAAREYLRQVNAAIRASVPEARKKISWSMPTYWKGRNLIQFAAFKRHIGLYPGPEAVEAFAGRLT